MSETIETNDENVAEPAAPDSRIAFVVNPNEPAVVEFLANGDIFVRGRLVENDKEVVEGFRDFLNSVQRVSVPQAVAQPTESVQPTFAPPTFVQPVPAPVAVLHPEAPQPIEVFQPIPLAPK